MAPANKARGETRIKLGDVEFVLVPGFERFAAIEESAGLGGAIIFDRLSQGSVGMAATVLRLGADSKLSRDEIGGLILENGGSTAICPALSLFMAQALCGFERLSRALAERGGDEGAPPAGETKSGDGSPLA